MSWLKEVLLAVDRLGNALSGGNSLCTISGRTGYYSLNPDIKSESVGLFWTVMEKVIDWAFLPVDGKFHCRNAHRWEDNILAEDGQRYRAGSDGFRALLAIIAIPVCILAGTYLRGAKLVNG